MNIKIAIADDHFMIAEGISNMLRPLDHIEIIARYETGAALLDGLDKQLPDVLLLDINFPDTTGNDLVRVIAKKHPQVRILALTSVENPYHITDMMRNGCLGYLLKNARPEILVQAIEQVYRGEEFIEPALKDQLLQAVLHPQNSKHIRLTKREQEILNLICSGETNYDIANKLFLSHRTIENHRLSLYQKFDVKNTAALVKIALQQGFIN